MTAKEILYKKCEEKDGCFLSGQVGWIVEAMEEYAKDIYEQQLIDWQRFEEEKLNTE